MTFAVHQTLLQLNADKEVYQAIFAYCCLAFQAIDISE